MRPFQTLLARSGTVLALALATTGCNNLFLFTERQENDGLVQIGDQTGGPAAVGSLLSIKLGGGQLLDNSAHVENVSCDDDACTQVNPPGSSNSPGTKWIRINKAGTLVVHVDVGGGQATLANEDAQVTVLAVEPSSVALGFDLDPARTMGGSARTLEDTHTPVTIPVQLGAKLGLLVEFRGADGAVLQGTPVLRYDNDEGSHDGFEGVYGSPGTHRLSVGFGNTWKTIDIRVLERDLPVEIHALRRGDIDPRSLVAIGAGAYVKMVRAADGTLGLSPEPLVARVRDQNDGRTFETVLTAESCAFRIGKSNLEGTIFQGERFIASINTRGLGQPALDAIQSPTP